MFIVNSGRSFPETMIKLIRFLADICPYIKKSQLKLHFALSKAWSSLAKEVAESMIKVDNVRYTADSIKASDTLLL